MRKKIEGLILYEAPKLREPYLVAGFSGWPNAGEVATGAVEKPKRSRKKEKVAVA